MHVLILLTILLTGGILYFMVRLLRRKPERDHGIIVGITTGVIVTIWTIFLVAMLTVTLQDKATNEMMKKYHQTR